MEHRQDGLFPPWRNNGELDSAGLDEVNSIRFFALRKMFFPLRICITVLPSAICCNSVLTEESRTAGLAFVVLTGFLIQSL